MKLMSELESLKAIYPSSCLCALYYAAQFNTKQFYGITIYGITKMPGRDLGAKFSLNNPKK